MAGRCGGDGLWGGIVSPEGRAAKCFAKVETHPAAPEIVGFGDDFALHNHTGIANGNDVILQIAVELEHARHQPSWRQRRPGFKLAHLLAARDPGLYVAAANIDGE